MIQDLPTGTAIPILESWLGSSSSSSAVSAERPPSTSSRGSLFLAASPQKALHSRQTYSYIKSLTHVPLSQDPFRMLDWQAMWLTDKGKTNFLFSGSFIGHQDLKGQMLRETNSIQQTHKHSKYTKSIQHFLQTCFLNIRHFCKGVKNDIMQGDLSKWNKKV